MSPADLNSQRQLWGSGCNRHPKPTRRNSGRRHFRPAFEQLESRRLLSTQSTAKPTLVLVPPAGSSVPLANSAPPGGALTPSQLRHAYGFDQTTFSYSAVQGDGSGQTIAIIDAYDDPNILGDLQQFDTYFGLPAPPTFTKVSQTGSTTAFPGTDPAGAGNNSWELETSLDVEWAHVLAPGANILLVEANSGSDPDLYAAVDYARNVPSVTVVSMSFGREEHSSDLGDNSHFTTPINHTGVTFLASTGDAGQPAEYPAYSPNVVAVGGTTLTVDANGNRVPQPGDGGIGESGWSGSGGGISTIEPQPAYQNGVVTRFSSSVRTAPDVAFDAGTYVAIYDSWDYGTTPWMQTGGTSFSVVAWGALIAVANQGRAINELASLDGATGTLPKLYSLPSADFNDIIIGSNGSNAGPGYDLVTGLGSPIVPSVVAGLIGPYTVSSSRPSAAGTVTSPPTSFTVVFSSPYATTNVSAAALQVNGIPADSVTQTDAKTLTFRFNSSPVTTLGLQTMSIAAGKIARRSDGVSLSSFSATFTYIVFPTPLASISPDGSLIYQNSVGGSIDFAGGTESFALSVAAGQTLTVLVTPAAGLQPGVVVDGPGVLTSASSIAAGTPVILQTTPIPTTGTYTFNIDGLSDTIGSYVVQAYLNAALSTSAHGGAANNSVTTAQNIDPSFIALGNSAQRGAVAGAITTHHRSASDAFGYQAATVAQQFDDISSTGSAILKGVDDGFVSVGLSGTFAFNFYGTSYATFNVSSNGLITLGSGTGTSAYANSNLQSSPSGPTIAPLWADLVVSGSANSDVYWQVKGSGSNQRLVVQWNDVSFTNGNNAGLVTFEAILDADGTILFNYLNLNSGDFGAGGVTATLGVKASGDQSSAGNSLLLSYKSTNSPYIGSGVSTEIGVGLSVPDDYAFSLTAGQTAMLVVTSQSAGAVTLVLQNAQGTTLASGTTLNTDVGQAIEGFVAPKAGTYYAAVSGDDGTPYTLVIDRNSDFDTKTGTNFAAAQNISGTRGVLGAILDATPDDWYAVDLNAGMSLSVQTYIIPGGGPAQFVNNLSPQIQLYSPSDVLLGSVAGNQSIIQQAAVSGFYRIHVSGGGTTGEYFLNTVVDATPPTATITPVSPSPRNSTVAQMQIVFNEPVTGFVLASLSLTRDGGANLLTASQTFSTSDNATFTLGNLAQLTGSSGTYTLTLTASGSGIADAAGSPLAVNTASSFVIDLTPPTVAITPVGPNPQISAVAQLNIVFSEPVTEFVLAALSLAQNDGANLLTSSQTLTTSDNTTFTLGNLASLTDTPGTYVLTLTAAGSGIIDAAGNALVNGASTSFVENVPAQVTTSGDSGTGTLRQALLNAAGAPGLTHTIQFDLPAGSQTINLLAPLPAIADQLIAALDATQHVTVASSSTAAWDTYSALTKIGAGTLTFTEAKSFNGNMQLDGGSLRFNEPATPTFSPGVTVTIMADAQLELAGNISDLTGGSNSVNISNNSTAAAGILVSGTDQLVGIIDGTGNLVVNSGSDLTANSIRQSALIIGGSASAFGMVTIAPSDLDGNALAPAALDSNSGANGGAAATNRLPVAASASRSAVSSIFARSAAAAKRVDGRSEALLARGSDQWRSSSSASGSTRPSSEPQPSATWMALARVTIAAISPAANQPPPPFCRSSLGGSEIMQTEIPLPALSDVRSPSTGFRHFGALDKVIASGWEITNDNYWSGWERVDGQTVYGEPSAAGLADNLLELL
ncbi:MAG TPA: Ig-like domain-containing protein [Pirellulales bacterium]|jgi:autotransporter-associated beta strand protein|nr:Ig-like domain-containing protein [Pirellulales bacterium]